MSDPLFEPLQLGQLTLKNRIMSTSHAIAYQEDGKPKGRYQAYHEAKAKGGLALTMFGGSSNIDIDSASVFGQLYVGNDDIIPHFQAFADRIHHYGTALMCQITHLGRRSADRGDWWLPTIGPSRTRERLHRAFCKQMDLADIKRVQNAYVDAAERCQKGGLDGIELMAGSHLPGQFLSPLTNQRDDQYGGTLDNRMRFLVEILTGIRERCGADFLVGMRLPSEEPNGGIAYTDTLDLSHYLAENRLLDFFNIYFGRMDAEHTLANNHLPGMANPGAPFLQKAAEFKSAVNLPVFHATRVSDVATARYAIREGLIDMVAMTRAHIADPALANKIQAGKEDEIRPCVGATLCSSVYRVCIHNAATGAEQTLPQQIEPISGPAKKAVVVGGGPAGMEAARVLARRGHQVTLIEAQSKLGGQLMLAAEIPWRKDLIGIRDWLESELIRLNVELRLNTYADAQDVLALNPDLVIVATGGLPDLEGIDGTEYAHSSWDVLAGELPTGDNILVFDETGRHAGSGVADFLAKSGKKVTLLSIDEKIGFELTETDIIAQRQRLAEGGVCIMIDRDLVGLRRDGTEIIATIEHILTGNRNEQSVDAVVIERGTTPLDEIFHDLADRSANQGVTDLNALVIGARQPKFDQGFELYRVGDAISSRGIHEAVQDALRLCCRWD
ncbi:MAG: NADH:flavin oxidoreductase [Gammaproteobacteria bacterium]|nr:NADH:flavin oxidoreductase [Gammaproteobacteria bacterium]